MGGGGGRSMCRITWCTHTCVPRTIAGEADRAAAREARQARTRYIQEGTPSPSRRKPRDVDDVAGSDVDEGYRARFFLHSYCTGHFSI